MRKRTSFQTGFTLVETLIAGAITSLIVFAGATVMSGTVKQEKKTSVQSLIDREFAAGAQIAANPANLAPFVKASVLLDCFSKDKNTRASINCSGFGGWRPYPNVTGPQQPTFNTTMNLNGPCAAGDPKCLVQRRMQYRWLCSADDCSGLETEVRVTPIGKAVGTAEERRTVVKLDRRQFFERAELRFLCDASLRTMRGVDYDQLSDGCRDYTPSTCSTPHHLFNPLDTSNDCSGALDRGCAYGFAATALHDNSVVCRELPGGRTVAGASTSTAPPSYSPSPTAIHVVNTQTVTSTVTTTVTQTAPTPACQETVTLPGEGYYRIPSGTIFYYNGVDAYCGFSSIQHFQNYARNPNPPSTNIAEMPRCKRYDGACPDPGAGDGYWAISRNDFSASPPYPTCAATTGSDPYWGQPCPRGSVCRYWNASGWWDIMACN